MENIDQLSEELEEIILNHLQNGLTFNPSDVENQWKVVHPDISFKTVLSKLVAKNKVGMIGKNTCEYRSPDRID